MLAIRKPKVLQATLTILPAPAHVLLAHSLPELSVRYQGVRNVRILLVLSEESQTFGYCVDGDLISERNGLNRS